jgi:asparagine synthase (glutamine-hydrolysing)
MCGIWAFIGDVSSISMQATTRSFFTLQSRGPDASRLEIKNNFLLGFHRLAIHDTSVNGQQPFILQNGEDTYYLICNGEIYNALELIEHFNLSVQSSSDCAIILPLFQVLGFSFTQLNQQLHGEYSLVIVKESKSTQDIEFFASTDPLSVRPLFMCTSEDKSFVAFSSIMQGLTHLKGDVVRFQQCTRLIGSYQDNKVTYNQERYNVNLSNIPPSIDEETIALYENIVSTLEKCVERRLSADVPLGCLLSGGLDSSLVAAIAARKLGERGQKLRTFSIGMEGSMDVYYATQVGEYIGSIHTNVTFTPQEGINVITDVIRATETYDITTIRASVGQYLLAKWIKENTDVKVILNGDGADECQMGYLYFNMAPDDDESQKESCRLVDEIHLYDGLRVDRCISVHGLEARVPFLDREFVDLYKSISPTLKRPLKERIEKNLIRKAFDTMSQYEGRDILPENVLYRKKEAFSDGVSNQDKKWYKYLQEHFDKEVADCNINNNEWSYLPPVTKEAYFYRYIFECLLPSKCSRVIPHYWLPSWCGEVNEPSATILSCYDETN